MCDPTPEVTDAEGACEAESHNYAYVTVARGHKALRFFEGPSDTQGYYVYLDTGEPVNFNGWFGDGRPCVHCTLPPTPQGADGCLGMLPGVEYACCGHTGVATRQTYIKYDDGRVVYGEEARTHQEKLKGSPLGELPTQFKRLNRRK